MSAQGIAQTVIAWLESADRSAVVSGITSRPDDQVTTTGDTIELPTWARRIAMLYVFNGTDATYEPISMQLGSPTINNLPLFLEKGFALSPHSRDVIYDWRHATYGRIPAGEQITAQGVEEDEATVAHYLGVCAVITNAMAMPKVAPYPITHIANGTQAVQDVANTWTQGAITLDTALPEGRYVILGGKVYETRVYAARLVVRGLPFRPALNCQTVIRDEPTFPGLDYIGCHAEFKYPGNPPELETLSTAADDPEVELYLYKVA